MPPEVEKKDFGVMRCLVQRLWMQEEGKQERIVYFILSLRYSPVT